MFDNHPHDWVRHGHDDHGHGHGGFPPFGGRGHGFGRGHHGGHAEDRQDHPSPAELWCKAMFGAMFGEGRGGRGGPGPREDRPRGPFGGGFGGPFGGGSRRPERLLEQGDLRWLVLDLIAAQPRHGYEIIKEIEDLLHGHYTPSPGVIYPTLTYLEETGLISGEAQGAKKLYGITKEGKAELASNAAAVQTIRTRIEAIRARFGDASAPELARAMDNLRSAIQIRLTKGALSTESLSAITAALDRAATEIERS